MTHDDSQSGSAWKPEPDATTPSWAQPAPHPSTPFGYGYPYAAYPPSPQPAPAKASRRKRGLVAVGGAAVAAALVVAGVGIGDAMNRTNGTGTVAQGSGTGATANGSAGSAAGSALGGSGSNGTGSPFGGFPGGSLGSGSSSGSDTSQSGTAASSTQQAGIVTIVSVLGYQNAEAAGTGMILTSNGEILTNNHVIDGATSVTVTVESSGRSYRANVVGTDPSDDVAVLQLQNASGLTTAKIGDSSDVAVGDAVTGVGNAGGTGTLSAASGSVTALQQSITATDETGSNAEKLTGLIETNAAIVAGDSGGPLYDSAGDIVGIDTAASTSGNQTAAATSRAYAIPIDSALAIADQIEAGNETSAIHIGLPAFLGVQAVATGSGGAGIASVVSGGPADDAGITAGSVITAVGGKAVTSPASLKTRLAGYEPGDQVSVTWTGAQGATHTATVTLISGAAD